MAREATACTKCAHSGRTMLHLHQGIDIQSVQPVPLTDKRVVEAVQLPEVLLLLQAERRDIPLPFVSLDVWLR